MGGERFAPMEDTTTAKKYIALTNDERLALVQTFHHSDERAKEYEKRRARRRVSEAFGIRKGHHWDVFPVPGNDKRATIALGKKEGHTFVKARNLGDRRVEVTAEAIDALLGAIGRRGGEVGDEDVLLDIEDKLRLVKAGETMDLPSLPGINDPSEDDDFSEAEDEAE